MCLTLKILALSVACLSLLGFAACMSTSDGEDDSDAGGTLGDWPTELLSPFPPFPELNGRIVSIEDRSEQEYQDLVVWITYRKPDPVLPVMQTYMQRLLDAGFTYGAGSEIRDGSAIIDLVYCGSPTGPFGTCEANQGGVGIGVFKPDSPNASMTFSWEYNP